MLVQQILKSKGDGVVFTIKPGTLTSDAAKLLTEKNIGGLVVSSDGKTVDGILSERDIVSTLAARGGSCLSETIDGMMTKNPVCCARSDTSDAVLARMTEGRFRHMPVVEDGVLVGIVTIGDMVKARLQELSMEKDALQGMIMGH